MIVSHTTSPRLEAHKVQSNPASLTTIPVSTQNPDEVVLSYKLSFNRLTLDDFHEVKQLSFSNDRARWRIPADKTDPVVEQMFKYAFLNEDSNYSAFGIKSGNRLLGMMLTYLSPQVPNLYVLQTYVNKTREMNVLEEVTKPLLRETLQFHKKMNGVETCVFMYPASQKRVLTRYWSITHLMPDANFTEMKIPANTRPNYAEYFNVLMERTLWGQDMMIRKYILTP